MKILIIQEQGRHDKNRNYRESLSFQRGFKKLGIDSVVWGLNYPSFKMSFNEVSKDCDVILLIENYESGWLPNISNFKGLKFFWSVDSHIIPQQHIQMCKNNKIDIVLNAIESHGNYFKPAKSYYFPNAHDDELLDYRPDIQKIYDVGFCGNYVNRKSWIDTIPNIKRDIFVIGDDMVKAINSYKIHFNRNIANDINYRTPETLGCKTFLLTNFTENLDKIYKIGEHLDIYNDTNDLKEKINYYLNNEEKRKKIEESGYQWVKQNHTYLKRCERLIEIIKENI